MYLLVVRHMYRILYFMFENKSTLSKKEKKQHFFFFHLLLKGLVRMLQVFLMTAY